MADIRLSWLQPRHSAQTYGDWSVEAGDLARDPTLETAVYLSLYTEADAPDDVVVPEGVSPHRWWGNAYWPRVFAALGVDGAGLTLGSLHWTLVRAKQTEETRLISIDFTRRALAWMTRIGLAKAVMVDAAWDAPGLLAHDVAITRPDALVERYQTFWRLP
jgi:phage gp46-like protein